MDSKSLYLNLVTNKTPISETLALALAYVPLSSEEKHWIECELNGYDDKLNVPEYRQCPCDLKARVQSIYNGEIQDMSLVGPAMDELDAMLRARYGLTINKLYIGQGVGSIEQQVSGHSEGEIIMVIDGPPGQELKDSIKDKCYRLNCTIKFVFQTAPVDYVQYSLSIIRSKISAILQKHFLDVKSNDNVVDEVVIEHKKVVFISYCWEDEEHTAWVKRLAEDLSRWVEVRIDQELPLGWELNRFMEHSVANSDKVLIIATPEYKDRADNRKRGVGYETSLITDDLVNDQNRVKFIPIIRRGTKETSYPKYLGSRKGLHMTDDNGYLGQLEELVKNLLEY